MDEANINNQMDLLDIQPKAADYCLWSLLPEVLVFVAGVMASRLLRGAGALAAQALRASSPSGVSVA